MSITKKREFEKEIQDLIRAKVDNREKYETAIEILKLNKLYKYAFQTYSEPVIVNDTIYIIGKEKKLIGLRQVDADERKFELRDKQPEKIFGEEGCILSKSSPYYRTENTDSNVKDSENDDIDGVKKIQFPDQLQLVYPDHIQLYNEDQIENLHKKDLGQHQIYHGTGGLLDAHSFVDFGLQLSMRDKYYFQTNKGEEEVLIWTHINNSLSRTHYYKYQNWWWQKKGGQKNPREFSFLGVYRKYCQADIFDCIRIQKLVNDQKQIRHIENETIFASFQGATIFSIFYSEPQVLEAIRDCLTSQDTPCEYDDSYGQIENRLTRKVYWQLALHERNSPMPKDSKNQEKKEEKKEKTGLAAVWKKIRQCFGKLIGKEKGAQLEQRGDRMNCNSLLYRCLHSEKTNSRDLILNIASLSPQFSLAKIFITQEDVRKLLQ